MVTASRSNSKRSGSKGKDLNFTGRQLTKFDKRVLNDNYCPGIKHRKPKVSFEEVLKAVCEVLGWDH